MKDGSKTTSEAFGSMSKETQALWKSFLDGKATGEEVFNAVVKELSNTEDKVKANQTAVGIFGTQWEDLEADVVAALDTSINKLGDFEGATQKAGEALTGTKTEMLKAKNREIIGSFEEAINSFLYFALVTGEKQPEIAETFNLFGENVSKGTREAIGGFLELSSEATTQIGLLKSSVVPLSQETATEVAGIYESMATQVRDAIAARQEETITSMQNFFATTSALSADEEANALAKMASNYETRTQVITDGENRIKEILNTAKEEKRSITDAEATEINAIQARMQTQAIDIMSASEAEQKSILERLKVEAGNITAQQAADVVKNSLKQKNESVKAAEEQYDKTVQEIIRQRDETGSISAEQAEKLIAEAKRQRDKSVAEAQIMHRDVVKEAKSQAKGQVDQVDWATGQVKNKFEQMREKVWGKMKEVGGDIKTEWNKAEKFLEDIDLMQIGKDIINGLIKGIKAKGEDIKKEAEAIGESIKKSLKKNLRIFSPSKETTEIGGYVGAGLVVGMKSKIKEVSKAAEDLAKAIKEQLNASRKWIDDRKFFNQLSLTEELAAWERVQKRYKSGTEERSQADREVYRVKKQINDELNRVNDEYMNKVEAANKRLIDGEKKLTDEYEKAVGDRSKALYSFAGLFDEVILKTDVSGQQLINNLKSQVDTFAEWAENIKSLAKRGIDEGLLAELEAMGPRAAAEIAALMTLTDEELKDYEGLWKEKNRLAREQATEELTGLQEETKNKIQELRNETANELSAYKDEWISKITQIRTGTSDEFSIMKSDMKTIGNEAINGLMEGLKENTGPLLELANEIANSVSETIRAALQIHSPSQKTEWLGKMVGQGLINGMGQTIAQIEYMAGRMAKATVPNTQNNFGNGNSNNGNVGSTPNFGPIYVSISAKDMQEFKTVTDFFNGLQTAITAN